MSSARPCKFGFTCRRADCWFSHPEGRQIDGAKAAPQQPQQQQYVVNANAQNFKPPPQPYAYGGAGGAAAAGYYQQQPMHGMAPHQMAPANSQAAAGAYRSVTRPLTPHAQQEAAAANGAAAAASSTGVAMLSDGKKPCKFGRECHRKDCYFSHPEGRDIDDSPHSSSASTPKQFVKKGGARAATDTPSDYDLEDDEDLDDTTVDALVTAKEWFPAYKDCTCCKGYIHDCEEPTCASLGTCANCAYGKDDEGGAAGGADEAWKDEWFGAARGCKCCEGYVYRCKAQQPSCKAQGKCFCQSAPAAAAAAPAAAAAAPAGAGAGAPGGPPA